MVFCHFWILKKESSFKRQQKEKSQKSRKLSKRQLSTRLGASEEETFKTLRIQPADTTITLSLTIPQEFTKLSSNRPVGFKKHLSCFKKSSRGSLEPGEKTKKYHAYKPNMTLEIRRRVCFFFPKDQANQILAV